MLLAVGMMVAGTYSTFETKTEHKADIEDTQEGIFRLIEYKDSLDEQRYQDTMRMLETLYDLHLGPRAHVNPADQYDN